MDGDRRCGRRALLGVTAALVSGCGTSPAAPPASGSSAVSPSTRSRASTPSAQALPSYVAWRPRPGENVPAAKLAAVRRIEALGNTTGRRLRVIDAQYGGLLATSASVLVVCESWSQTSSGLTSGGHTFDVRISRTGATWTVTRIHPSRPGPAAAHLSHAARHALRSTRISLPPAAREDIESGTIHDSVLEAMLAMSARWRIAVSVIRSGHPLHVFGTTRLSDHPFGRAYDTWAIDGAPVVAAGRPHRAVPAYMEALASAGSYNVGGPVLLGAAPQYFSDATHHDHVHAGFEA